MSNRLSRIYTRTGDAGETGLADGSRIGKDTTRIEAIGDVDELNSALGVLLGQALPRPIRQILDEVQHDLFTLGGELSLPGKSLLEASDTSRLEAWLDQFNADLPPLREFILPAGGPAVGACHLARAVCRRAERTVVRLNRVEKLNPTALTYLNRLSDLLFVLARLLAREAGASEVYWRNPTRA